MKIGHRSLQRGVAWASVLVASGATLRAGLQHRVSSVQGAISDRQAEVMSGKSFQETRRIRYQALKRLKSLWKQRSKRNIVRDVLPYVKHPLQTVQLPAVKILGRLENPVALPSLKEMNVRIPSHDDLMTNGEESQSPLGLDVPLAIGRIQSEGLTGQAKVEAVLRPIGFSFSQLALCTVQLSKDYYGADKPINRVVEEVLEVLYTQRRNGEDVSSMARRLRLRPGQELFLQVAQKPTEQQAKLVLDCVTRPGRGVIDSLWLIDHLLDWGPKARAVVFTYANQIRRDRKRYPVASLLQYMGILLTLAEDGEPRAKALLTLWSRDNDPQLAGFAENHLFQLKTIVPS